MEQPQPQPSVATHRSSAERTDGHKGVVRRLVDEVMNAGRLEVVDELYTPALGSDARRWMTPFRESFPDVPMEVVNLVAEGDIVAARFVCSGSHLGVWRGHAPTGRRFRVDEVYFFEFADGRIARAGGIEDTHRRLKQLGLGS